MIPPAFLSDLLATGRSLRPAGDQIWSAMAEGVASQRYDGRAAVYDRVVGSRLYNRLLWGSSPAAYAAFAARALRSDRGPMLDAGCGSLVFTAGIYAEPDRPLVLVDRSLGMLEAARDRLTELRGRLPSDTVFIQADLLDLPFSPGGFPTVLSMGMLHLFEDLGRLLAALDRAVASGGHLYLTSLVAERRIGRAYLSALHRAGEVASPRSYRQVVEALHRKTYAGVDSSIQGSMAFLTLVTGSGLQSRAPDAMMTAPDLQRSADE